MKLIPNELAHCALQAWTPALYPTDWKTHCTNAVAVSLAESAGDTEAIARTNDLASPSLGQRAGGVMMLSNKWQWDKIIAAGADWRNPYVNFAIAHQIWLAGGKKFSPWNVTQGGATAPYRQFLPDAAIGVEHPFPCVPYVDNLADIIHRVGQFMAGGAK